MPIDAMAIGAGVGVLKSALVDAPEEAKQRQLQAQIEKYSPWTGQKGNPQAIKIADPFGSALQGASSLGAQQQNLANSKALQNYLNGNSKGLDTKNGTTPSLPDSMNSYNYMKSSPTAPGPWSFAGSDPNTSIYNPAASGVPTMLGGTNYWSA